MNLINLIMLGKLIMRWPRDIILKPIIFVGIIVIFPFIPFMINDFFPNLDAEELGIYGL